MTPTYLLTWNPTRWLWKTLAADARRSRVTDVVLKRWSCGNTKRISPGDRLFLMRLGEEPKGIVASGWAVSAPQVDEHWDSDEAGSGREARYVDAEFERILNYRVESPLLEAELRRLAPAYRWTPQGSGIAIRTDVAQLLEEAWAAHVGTEAKPVTPDEEVAALEGHLRLRIMRHRRREQSLRAAKIDATLSATGKLACEVPGCTFDFARVYGELGRGYAQVHHRQPLASTDAPRLTKVGDLAIVCANCHAIIHRGGECRPLDTLITGASAS